jgi:nitrogen fixation protein NifB
MTNTNNSTNSNPMTEPTSRPSCKSKCESEMLTSGIKNSASTFGKSQLQKVANHPCYSNDAHHKYARMHLPVAPACNIQCNYCNRKYDCANESRPGVVSELLTPEQALLKAQAVAKAIPQLSVIGIAGPGDPLANPVRTFKTLELIREAMPDIKLCLSTNGLTLVDYVDDLVKYGVDHVTITLNTLDEVVGAQIYEWVYLDGKRYTGVEGARILIDRQMQGIKALAKAGILTKINSVLIPGMNDDLLPELSKTLRANDVFLHNIMPLISKAEHGTYFGLNGQREPSEDELDKVRELAGANVSQMKHCQQCRADAIGLIKEDRSAEFNLEDLDPQAADYSETMQDRCRFQSAIISKGASENQESLVVAVATKNNQQIDLHFGHADCFKLYLVTENKQHFIGERRITRYCVGEHNEETATSHDNNLASTVRALLGVDLVLCCRIGTPPTEALEAEGIQPVTEFAYHGVNESLSEVFTKYASLAKSKWLKRQEKVEEPL